MNTLPNPDDIDQLEKLALSLLVYPGDPRVSKPRLFLGKIPENFPIAVPISAQSRVMGTLARSETQIEIVLENTLTPEEVLDFYRTQLTSQGWREPEELWPNHERRGFLNSSFGPHTALTFCQEASGAGLTVNTLQVENTTTTVRLDLSLDREMNPCAQQAQMHNNQQQSSSPRRMIPFLFGGNKTYLSYNSVCE